MDEGDRTAMHEVCTVLHAGFLLSSLLVLMIVNLF